MYIAELIDITKEYPQPGINSHTRILDNISLSISNNETLAITGPSGSGKSTLLNILGTLDSPTSGKVILGGNDVATMNEVQMSSHRNRFIGFIFQLHMLLPQLTILENILLPVMPLNDKVSREEAGERGVALLQRVGLGDFLHQYPSRMSVGECQRAAVVRALINRPNLLLADEPTGSLDARNAAILAELLAELHETYQYALVLVTHDPMVAAKTDKIYNLFNGSLRQPDHP